MTSEEIFKKWKHKAPKGATHCLIVEGRKGICWFVGKDFNIPFRENGIQPFRYPNGIEDIKSRSHTRTQKLIPLNINLENK